MQNFNAEVTSREGICGEGDFSYVATEPQTY